MSTEVAKIYIGQLSFDANERDLEGHFGKYGRISNIQLKKGFCFILFILSTIIRNSLIETLLMTPLAKPIAQTLWVAPLSLSTATTTDQLEDQHQVKENVSIAKRMAIGPKNAHVTVVVVAVVVETVVEIEEVTEIV
eukprot:gene2471-2811_t